MSDESRVRLPVPERPLFGKNWQIFGVFGGCVVRAESPLGGGCAWVGRVDDFFARQKQGHVQSGPGHVQVLRLFVSLNAAWMDGMLHSFFERS